MLLEFHDKFASPVIVNATRLVVYDDFHQPVAFVLQTGPDSLRLCTVKDEDFQFQLQQHGMQSSAIITRVNGDKFGK